MDAYRLNNDGIAEVTRKIDAFLSEHRVENEPRLRITLASEEILLKYAAVLTPDTPVQLICDKRLGRLRVILKVQGKSVNPFDGDDENGWLLRRIMENMSVTPSWVRRGDANEITFSLSARGKVSSIVYVLSAAALGLILGFAARLLPETACQTLCDTYLAPLSNAVMGLLSTLATLVVFLSVTCGICGMGDMSTFQKIGKRMLLRFFRFMALSTVLGILISLLFFPIDRNGIASLDVASLYQMVLDIVPTNIVNAFATGNTLQIIFLAALIGIMLLTLSSKTHSLIDMIQQLNTVLLSALQLVIRLMPLVVFVSLFRLAAVTGLGEILNVYKFVIYLALCCFGSAAFSLLRVAVTRHVPVRLLLRKILPTFAISFSTSSSSAAFSTNIDTCENSLGIDKQLVNVGVPLGQTIFKNMGFLLIGGALCMAELYGVPITLSKIVTLMISAYVLAIAAPPVPGGATSCISLVFLQLGIPIEAISVMLALDPLIDRICTCTMLPTLQMELTQISASLGTLNHDVLRSEQTQGSKAA